MSDVQEFDPRTFNQQRRERLARIAAAAIESPWPIVEKQVEPDLTKPPVFKRKEPPVLPPSPAFDAPGYKPPHVSDIQLAVSRQYGIALLDLRSARRTADIVLPRQIAMYLTRALTLNSLPAIGRMFGGRDHTTVLHAIRRVETAMARDPLTADIVAAFIKHFGGVAGGTA